MAAGCAEAALPLTGLTVRVDLKGQGFQQLLVSQKILKLGGKVASSSDTKADIVCLADTASNSEIAAAESMVGSGEVVKRKWVDDCAKEMALLNRAGYRVGSSIEGKHPDRCAALGTSTHRVLGKRPERPAEENALPKLAPIFMSPAERAKASNGWCHDTSLQYISWWSPGFAPTSKIAAYDMDGTIITTITGKTFPKNADDWRLLQPTKLTAKLLELKSEGFAIVLISNQKGLGNKRDEQRATGIRELQRKVGNIQQALKMPLAFYAAYGSNALRKPAPGMWERVCADFAAGACSGKGGEGVAVDALQSFYVGDAAGRPEPAGGAARAFSGHTGKDFADSDRKFALNAGLGRFSTPEEHFLGAGPEAFALSGFDPAQVLAAATGAAGRMENGDSQALAMTGEAWAGRGGTKELVLLVGWPGAGKTTLAKRGFVDEGYEWVNQDTLKTRKKCLDACRAALASGRGCVIDNTNPAAKTRREFLEIARQHGAPARVVWLAIDRDLAHHLNRLRGFAGGAVVPPIAYMTFEKELEAPSEDEGFARVDALPFTPRFAGEEDRRRFLWRL